MYILQINLNTNPTKILKYVCIGHRDPTLCTAITVGPIKDNASMIVKL